MRYLYCKICQPIFLQAFDESEDVIIKSEETETSDEESNRLEDLNEPSCSRSHCNNSYYPARSKNHEPVERFHHISADYSDNSDWKSGTPYQPINGFVKTEMLNGGYFERDLIKKEHNFISDMVTRCSPESKYILILSYYRLHL